MATLDSEFEFAFEPSNWSSLSNQPMEPEPLMKKKRARARLDHMTPEEKQERRKEKNRQAAQTARDRKRSRLEKLEEENQRLREENMRLRSAILGNSRDQSVVDCSPSQAAAGGAVPVLHPNVQIIDSGVSDVDSKSATTTFMSSPMNSSYNYGTTLSSPEQNDDNLFNSVMERDNDVALVNEIQKLVSYVNGDNDDGVSIESAALINEPQQQVQDISTGLQLAGNSLGWTSVQLMLILMISRIHHRLSAKIDCCQRAPTRSNDEMDPNNCNLYDYLLHTRCADFRRAAETIISNKSNVRHQRLIALNFVQKYLYHTNINRKNHNSNNSSNNNNSNKAPPVYQNENSSDRSYPKRSSAEEQAPVSISSTTSHSSSRKSSHQMKQQQQQLQQQQQKQQQQQQHQQLIPPHQYSPLKCSTCRERLEDRHFVQCPSVMAHKFCFACSKVAIERQQLENKKLGNGFDRVFCPSGNRCFLATEHTPWTFMNSEIETIFRESSRQSSSASSEANSHGARSNSNSSSEIINSNNNNHQQQQQQNGHHDKSSSSHDDASDPIQRSVSLLSPGSVASIQKKYNEADSGVAEVCSTGAQTGKVS